MKKVVIIGAGHMGRAVAGMLNPNESEFIGFADNDSEKWSNKEPRIFSVKTAVDLEPDVIIISATDDDEAREIKEQIRICRFYGDILFMNELARIFDFSKIK